jgi:hypothetical protein
MTESVFVDGQWQTPSLCDECIVENASKPLTKEQQQDFVRVSEQLLRIAERDFRDNKDDDA